MILLTVAGTWITYEFTKLAKIRGDELLLPSFLGAGDAWCRRAVQQVSGQCFVKFGAVWQSRVLSLSRSEYWLLCTIQLLHRWS